MKLKTQVNDVWRKTAEMQRKISGKFPTVLLLSCSRYFPCFPGGSGDFPASFLEDPVRSGGSDDRPRDDGEDEDEDEDDVDSL
jgi:hypothetical protein